MSKFSKMIRSVNDQVHALGMYALLSIVNAFSRSTYVKVEQSNIVHEG